MKKNLVALWLAGVCGMAAWTVPVVGETAAAPAEVKTVAADGNAFALDLYGQLAAKEGNLFFSPYSIRTALAMTYAGARGQTEKEMGQVLHFSLPPDRLHAALAKLSEDVQAPAKEGAKAANELLIANALWCQNGYAIQPKFQELLKADYGAGLREVDFATAAETARADINTWVEKQTRDKIKDLIGKGVLGRETRLVLVNAIYMKCAWETAFDKAATETAPFHAADGKSVDTPLMHRKAQFKYFANPQIQAVEIPYVGDRLSMVAILPGAVEGEEDAPPRGFHNNLKRAIPSVNALPQGGEGDGGLAALGKSLTSKDVDLWLAGMTKREVDVFIPRFKLEASFELADTLKAMGMKDAFTRHADFSGIATQEQLQISNVIHKAYVDVNEEGTEAAAATGVVMAHGMAMARPLVFRADRPFLFLIRDRQTGAIVFLGRVAKP